MRHLGQRCDVRGLKGTWERIQLHVTLLPFLHKLELAAGFKLYRKHCAIFNCFFCIWKFCFFPSGPMSHNETGSKIAAVMVLREKTECQKSGRTISQWDCCCNRNDADDILFLCADVHVRRTLRFSLHFHRAICPQQTSCRIQVY